MTKISNTVVDQLKLQLQSAKMRLEEETTQLEKRKAKREEVLAEFNEKVTAQEETIENIKIEIGALENAVNVLYASLPDAPEGEPADAPPAPTEDLT